MLVTGCPASFGKGLTCGHNYPAVWGCKPWHSASLKTQKNAIWMYTHTQKKKISATFSISKSYFIMNIYLQAACIRNQYILPTSLYKKALFIKKKKPWKSSVIQTIYYHYKWGTWLFTFMDWNVTFSTIHEQADLHVYLLKARKQCLLSKLVTTISLLF